MGPGRWDADALARELEVSTRTIHRILAVLEMSGVPWYYSKENECYRVRPGFRFPGIEIQPGTEEGQLDVEKVSDAAAKVLQEGERFLEGLRAFCEALRTGKVSEQGQ